MKKPALFALFACLALLIAACGGPIETLEFKSPDGDRSITVSGVRETPAAPISLKVVLKSPQASSEFAFEHPAGSLTNENCKATWINNFRATLTFTMSDGETWDLECFLLDERLEAIKRYKIDGRSIF